MSKPSSLRPKRASWSTTPFDGLLVSQHEIRYIFQDEMRMIFPRSRHGPTIFKKHGWWWTFWMMISFLLKKNGWPRTSNLKVSLFGFAPPPKKNWSDGYFWPLLFKATENRDFLAKRVLREITRGIVNHQTDAESQAGMEDATGFFLSQKLFWL